MLEVFFCFSNNSEVSRISLWVWWVSLFSFSFFTGFNNWFLIRRHISLSGLDLSHIQHLLLITCMEHYNLFVHHVLFVPLCSTLQRWKIFKKISCIWREWTKSWYFDEKVWALLKMCLEFWLQKSKCLLLHGRHAFFFLFTPLHLCQGI